MPEVLRDLNRQTDDYTINFMYNELEDFLVTTHIRRKSIPDALLQVIGFYPVSIVKRGERELFVECTHKTEHHLTGAVTDERGLPVAYANIVVLHPADSTMLGGGVSNESGYFAIPYDTIPIEGNGEAAILVRITHIGYQTVHLLCRSQHIGTVRMQSEARRLTGVTITGQGAVVRREAGTIVFDARQIVGAIDAADLLRYLPGVYVDDDNISLFGSSGVIFCINGKEQHLGQREMLQMLKSYPASDVEKIEITQAPESKYGAAGNAGVINLILKKKDNDYTGGTLGYARTQYETHGDEANANVVYNKGRVSTSLHVTGTWDNTCYEEANVMTLSNLTRNDIDHGRLRKDIVSGRWQLDYNANARFTLGAYAMYTNGKRELNVDSKYDYDRMNTYGMTMLNTQNNRSEDTKTFAMNAYASQKLGDKGDQIVINADYYHTHIDDNRISEAFNPMGGDIPDGFHYHNDIRHTVTNYSAKADAKVGPFMFGSQLAFTRSIRHLKFNWIEGYIEKSHFNYDEQVLSAYSEYSGKLGSRLTLNIGGRYEHTLTKKYRPTFIDQDTLTNRYGRFFPSLSLTYQPNSSHSLNWSLSSRITRPNIINVNPDTLYSDAYHITTGNSLLKPAYLYKAMMSYTYNRVLSFDFYYAYESDRMALVSHIINDESTFRIWDNAIGEKRLGINSLCHFDRLRWMKAILTQGIWWSKTTGYKQDLLPKKECISYTGTLQTSLFFDRDRKWTATLNVSYCSPEKDVARSLSGRYKADAGLQYRFWKERLTVGLVCRNLFASRIKGTEYLGETVTDFDNKLNYRQLHLTLTYNWGASLRHDKRRYESDEMQERIVNDF